MKSISKVFPRRIDRELHLSEQSVWQTLAELYRVGWLKSVNVDKLYIEKIQKMPAPKIGNQEWQRIALVSTPRGHKNFGRLTLVIQLNRYDSEREYWGPALHVQMWSEHAEQIGMRPLHCLRNAGDDPLLWISDHGKGAFNPWKTIDLLGERTKRRFVRLFLKYLKSPDPSDEESPQETFQYLVRMHGEKRKFRAWMKQQQKMEDAHVERTLKHLTRTEEVSG